MLVCHEWANVLRSTCLYDTIAISKTSIFVRFVQFLEEQPQVKELVLLGALHFNMDETQFDRLFFNVRSTYFGSGIIITGLGYAQNRSPSLKHWGDQIKTVQINHHSRFMYTILTSSVCPNLTTLSLNGRFLQTFFFERLTNAPNLENPTVFSLRVFTRLLEKVHAAVPALKTLELIEASFTGNIDIGQINSSDSMKAIHVHFTNKDPDTILHWLKYISIKYINITTLSFVCSKIPSEWLDGSSPAAESSILSVLQN
jgi:hypothetical protein